MSTAREAMLNRVRHLLNKTVENGATESEHLAALRKANAMIEAYVITDEELALSKEEKINLHVYEDPSDPHKIKWRLLAALGQFCHIEAWRKGRAKNGHYEFLGADSDVEWARWLLDHLTAQVTEWLVDHLCSSLAPPSERRRVIRDFVIGATSTLSDAMIEMATEAESARTGNGRALVVSREGAIALKMKELGIKLFFSTERTCIGHDADDYDAGRRAGHQATFGRPITGAGAVLRLK